jgi:hypothetical protein
MNGASPDGGFMVSMLGTEMKRIGSIHALDIYSHVLGYSGLNDIRRLNLMDRAFLGTWYDKETELSFIDVSIRYGTPGEAIDAVRRNKQRAYYDVAAKETVYL